VKAIFLALLLIAMSLAHAAAAPRVRVEVETKEPILVGQQVRVNVTVLAPNFFLSPPQFPAFDIPGAIVTLLDENALNGTETIDGETYAGIRRTYAITPERAGDFTLPPAQIAFSYAAEPGRPGVAGSVTLPPQTFTARLADGMRATQSPALVAKVVVTQTLDGDPKEMKVGDALTRTVETFAANTQAMMIPPPTFDAPRGVRVYRRDPVLANVTSDRDDFAGGRRIDRVTYVFEEPGSYALPAIEVGWFNAKTGKQEISRAPEIDVSVIPAPAPRTDMAPPAPPPQDELARNSKARAAWQRALAWSLGLLIAALAALWALRRFWPRIHAWAQARRQAYQASEAHAFARLKRACSVGDPAAAYRELGNLAKCQGFKTVQALCEDEPALGWEIKKLERLLYGGTQAPAAWNGRALLDAAAGVRASRRAADRNVKGRRAVLPELNP
jgi:BatD DUF11 like domain